MNLNERMKNIRCLLSDVDGVLTNGAIVYDNNGVETKRFSVRDGLGIKLWQRAGHSFGIVTARNSKIVEKRTAELGVDIVRQGFEEKLPVVLEIIDSLSLSPEQTAYVGDDLPDLKVIQSVGLGVAAGDAVAEVKQAARFTTSAKGGSGVVRELVETILKAQGKWPELIADYSIQ